MIGVALAVVGETGESADDDDAGDGLATSIRDVMAFQVDGSVFCLWKK